jgi:hypothetical protein
MDKGGGAMDTNEYLIERLVRQRLAEAEATATRLALVAKASPPRAPLRVALGSALIRLGRRLAESPAGAPAVTAS